MQSGIGYHYFFYLGGKRTYLETILFEFLKQLNLEIYFFNSYEDTLSKTKQTFKKASRYFKILVVQPVNH